jgi:hypothetical protein
MAMKIDRIQPAGMNVRIQQGKPAYSHVVKVTGPGKTIYIAGQLARNAEGNIVGPGDMRAQLEQTFKNLDACLKAAGGGLAQPDRRARYRGSQGRARAAGETITGWIVDRSVFRVTPRMSDGTLGPALELRELFDQSKEGLR